MTAEPPLSRPRPEWRPLAIGGLAAALAVLLRVYLLWRHRIVAGDAFVYADIADNWLEHGIYGLTRDGIVRPTMIRLPGYPAFLAAVFSLFGRDNFTAVLWLQIVVDVGTCFVIAALARRLAGEPAARWTLFLAALCPFLASYAVDVLTETWAIFFTSIALLTIVRALEAPPGGAGRDWLLSGLAIAAAMYQRPDSGLLALFLIVYLVVAASAGRRPWRDALGASGAVLLVVLAALVPWTIRNARTFGLFQPLVPHVAVDPGEFRTAGFDRWVRTWIADYSSVDAVCWHVPGRPIELGALPRRAFDDGAQRQRTQDLLRSYNDRLEVTPELDREFAALAEQRIAAAPLRYYVFLPALRLASVWLRPRSETWGHDPEWWRLRSDRHAVLDVALALVNLALLAFAAFAMASRDGRHLGFLLLFVVGRSLLVATLEFPEPRYVLECYPVVLALAGAGAARLARRGAALSLRP